MCSGFKCAVQQYYVLINELFTKMSRVTLSLCYYRSSSCQPSTDIIQMSPQHSDTYSCQHWSINWSDVHWAQWETCSPNPRCNLEPSFTNIPAGPYLCSCLLLVQLHKVTSFPYRMHHAHVEASPVVGGSSDTTTDTNCIWKYDLLSLCLLACMSLKWVCQQFSCRCLSFFN